MIFRKNKEELLNRIEELEEENRRLNNIIHMQERRLKELAQLKEDEKLYRQFCYNILNIEYNEDLPNLVELSNEELCLLAAEKLQLYIDDFGERYDYVVNKYKTIHHEAKLFVEKYIYFLTSYGLSRAEAENIIEDPQKVFEIVEGKKHIGKSSATNHYILDVAKESDSLDFSDEVIEIINQSGLEEKHVNKDVNKKRPARKFSNRDKEVLDKMSYNCDDVAWAIIEAIGSLGVSQRKRIVEEVLDIIDYTSKPTKINATIMQMAEIDNIIKIEKIKLPSAGNVDIVQLGENGVKLYEYHFNEKPIESEAHRIIAEHDNLQHGYGIMFLSNDLYKLGRYSRIRTTNKSNGIEVTINNQKTVYVPDLICFKNVEEIDYYEYELDNHNIKNFCIKCDKMLQVTDTLRFVVPNKDVALSLNKKIESWLRDKSAYSLKNTFIYIYSYKSLVEEDKPLIEYNLNVSTAPVKTL